MDKLLAELRMMFSGMTLEQRRQLKIIIGLIDDPFDESLAGTLVDLALVVKLGNTYCATPAGGYVARQN